MVTCKATKSFVKEQKWKDPEVPDMFKIMVTSG
jgi:hypothetical protein